MVSTRIVVISEENIRNFCQAYHDFNPIHLDENYARETKFCARIAPGLMVASYISGLISDRYPGAIYLEQNLQFKHPAYIGDELKIVITPLEQQEGYKLNLGTQIFCKEQVIINGTAKILLLSPNKN